jgi:hypothetical protein
VRQRLSNPSTCGIRIPAPVVPCAFQHRGIHAGAVPVVLLRAEFEGVLSLLVIHGASAKHGLQTLAVLFSTGTGKCQPRCSTTFYE